MLITVVNITFASSNTLNRSDTLPICMKVFDYIPKIEPWSSDLDELKNQC